MYYEETLEVLPKKKNRLLNMRRMLEKKKKYKENR